MRRIVVAAFAVIAGLLVCLGLLLPSPWLGRVADLLLEGALILAAFALLLGLLNVLRTHAQNVVKGPRRGQSIVLIVALLLTLAIGVVFPQSAAQAWVFDYIYLPIQATLGALLAFVVLQAAFRAFRLRTVDAAILLASSLIMLFLQIPATAALWPRLGAVRDWMLAVPVAAGIRGLLLGVALGTMATALRILFAVDRPYTGEE